MTAQTWAEWANVTEQERAEQHALNAQFAAAKAARTVLPTASPVRSWREATWSHRL